ncbi:MULTISPECIES: hypothetical protein [unclassified Lentimicrobium]|uniref:hypothetical protein n=1 Tax=unclassified Lentimicrobium TaxID=2677434 RepID=UPI0015548DE7|nr:MULTISPECIES: hypothetical protein [unclassified Lentimicrobium]NPD46139.1 hypothetical protein [Lentimicrobium sp. S6]NPD86303.1 hypothetical protein [Lentimicrobium sp. L6]
MKKLLILLLTLISGITFGQDKYNYVSFDKLTEIEETEYVIASIQNRGKIETKSKYLLFINTIDGKTQQIDLPKDSYIMSIEQILIKELDVNKIVLVAKTVNLDGDKEIDWSDPQQIIILSTDGKEKTQLTDISFFVRTWTTNKMTGTITVTGHYDSNSNGKYDKTDKNEILIYDLKAMELKTKI